MSVLLRARKSAIASATVLAFILLMFLGRILGMPVAIIIVSGRSMQPTLWVGDLVVGIRGSFRVGDIVVWCLRPTFCVIHRVISVRDGYVVTKGDNNPAPDPPVPRSLVRYRVVAVIPRYVWVPMVVAAFAAYVAGHREYLTKRRVAAGDVAVLLLSSFIVFNAAIALLAPTYYPRGVGVFAVPQVELSSASIMSNGSILVKYVVRNTHLTTVAYCSLRLKGWGSIRCSARVVKGSEVLIADVPQHLYEAMIENGSNPLLVSLVVNMLYGKVSGTYYIWGGWRPLRVRVSGGVVSVFNPNPAPVRVLIKVYTANRPGPANVSIKHVILKPWGRLKLDLRGYAYASVRITYRFRGREVVLQYGVRP